MADVADHVQESMFGISALTQKKKLFGFAMVFSAFGIAFGVSGFVHGNLRPDWLATLLG